MDSLSKITIEPRKLRLKMIQMKREALFTDVTLYYYSKSLKVHKCMLSANSLFFKLLFTQTNGESVGTFDLTPFVLPEDSEMVESIITFMYSGVICLCESNIVVISSLAQYFGIDDLTAACVSYVMKILTAENCVKLFCQIRSLDKEFQSLDNRVTIHKEKEIESTILKMVSSLFYKNVLLQDDALQFTIEDLWDILVHVDSKDFSIGNTMTFLAKWLKLHSVTEAAKIAEALIDQAFEKAISDGQQDYGDTSQTTANLDELLILLASPELPDDTRVKFETELKAIKEEMDKMMAAVSEMEVKEESMEESGNDANVVVENVDQEGFEDDTNCYDGATDEEEEEESIQPVQIKKNKVPIWKMKVKKLPTRKASKAAKSVKANSKKRGRPAKKTQKTQKKTPVEAKSSFREISISSDEDDSLEDPVTAKGTFKCKTCKKVFLKKKTFTLHQRCHAAKTYKCVVCGMKFGRSYHLERHMTSLHSDMEVFECEECPETYTQPKEFVRHINSHRATATGKPKDEGNKTDDELSEIVTLENGQKEYRCTMCEKTFSNNTHLREHIMIHTGNRPYTCSACDKKFKNNYDLKKHIKTVHLGEGSKYKCENCKKPFNVKEALDRHKEKCQGRSFHCEVCGASFYRKYHLDRHLSVHTDDKPFSCPQCPKLFKNEYKLKAHILTHDENEVQKQSVVCELCGAVLKNMRYLKRHLQAHTGVKPHKCPVCQNSYSQAGSLQVHMRMHTGAKPFQCEICSMLFAVKSNLMRHQRRHRGDRKHKCDQCGKGFVMMGDLRRHYTIHTGEKNYACKYCNKKFSSKSKLPQHERIHTGEKPYECRVCGKRFIQSGDRHRHEAIHGLKPQKIKHVSLELAYLGPDTTKDTVTNNTENMNSTRDSNSTQNLNTIQSVKSSQSVNSTQNVIVQSINTTQNVNNTQDIINSSVHANSGNDNQPTDYSGNKRLDDRKDVSGNQGLIGQSYIQVPSLGENADKNRLYSISSQSIISGEAVQHMQTDQEPVQRTPTLSVPFGVRNLGSVSGAISASVAINSIGSEIGFMNANAPQGNSENMMNPFHYEY